jgi:site-specific DNA-methyltransferase (adenine-specific)
VYALVPQQDFTELWTDEKLYKKYDISEKEQQLIDSLIKDVAWGDLTPIGVEDE